MPKASSRSVTEINCKCRVIQDLIARKMGPFQYNEEMNEYHIFDGKSSTKLYHCFVCGGVLSESKRDEKFYAVDNEEMNRIKNLCSEIKTIQEAISKLGNPDFDYPHGTVVSEVGDSGRIKSSAFRSIIYTQLSKTAEISFTETKTGTAFLSIRGKPKE